MKKMLLCSIIALLLLPTKGFASRTEAIFTAADKNRIQLIIHGKLVNETPQRHVFIQDRPGRHNVEIRVFNRWGRLQFIHTDWIVVKPNSKNTFLLQVHAYGNVRLVQQSRTVPAKSAATKVPKPIKHHVPMVTFIEVQERYDRPGTRFSQPADKACPTLA